MSKFMYIIFLACAVSAKGSDFHNVQKLNTKESLLVLAFLKPPDLGKYGLTSRHNQNLLIEHASSPVDGPSGQNLLHIKKS